MKTNNTKWVNGIDSIRFFLALIVFLSHIHNPYVDILKNSSSSLLHALGLFMTPMFSGTSAVIAFFIISGFVIHYPNKNKPLNVKNFLIRRWLRIGIPLVVIGAFAACFKIYAMIPVWSLYCELIYYTIYPLLLKLKMSWKLKFQLAFLLSIIVIVIFGNNDVMALFHQTGDNLIGQYWQLGVPLTWIVGLPCWLLGVLLAEEFDSMHKEVSVSKLWLYRLLVFGVSVLIQVLRFRFYASTLITENLFALLLFVWLRNEFTYYKRHSSVAFFEHLGKFSYSLYLCHEIFVFFIVKTMSLNAYTYPVFILITVAGSYLVYLLVEYPSHRLAQLLTKKKQPPLAV